MLSRAAFAGSRISGVATRYDKLARDFLAAVYLAAIVTYWIN